MTRNISLILNAEKPDEMSERFRELYAHIDEKAKITDINLGRGFTRDIPATTHEILFSGGVREKLSSNPELDEEIKRLCRATGEPILGVCFGGQVVARQHGARLIQLPEKRLGIAPITIAVAGNPYLDRLAGEHNVYESHSWALNRENFPKVLDVMGTSEDGVEVFAHSALPQGGVQFHPEREIGSSAGVPIFAALRKTVLDKTPKR